VDECKKKIYYFGNVLKSNRDFRPPDSGAGRTYCTYVGL